VWKPVKINLHRSNTLGAYTTHVHTFSGHCTPGFELYLCSEDSVADSCLFKILIVQDINVIDVFLTIKFDFDTVYVNCGRHLV